LSSSKTISSGVTFDADFSSLQLGDEGDYYSRMPVASNRKAGRILLSKKKKRKMQARSHKGKFSYGRKEESIMREGTDRPAVKFLRQIAGWGKGTA